MYACILYVCLGVFLDAANALEDELYLSLEEKQYLKGQLRQAENQVVRFPMSPAIHSGVPK